MDHDALQARSVATAGAQPNEVDRKRIERALAGRARYRYVSPRVHPVHGGYLVDSPCCSRNIDAAGGVIDVALVQYTLGPQPWLLYRKDHVARQWLLHAAHKRLADLLELLNIDPLRLFWQ